MKPPTKEELHNLSECCDDFDCQICCEHIEVFDDMCLDCGKNLDTVGDYDEGEEDFWNF
jgi:hypothetical protein